jgi:hypothetical protein
MHVLKIHHSTFNLQTANPGRKLIKNTDNLCRHDESYSPCTIIIIMWVWSLPFEALPPSLKFHPIPSRFPLWLPHLGPYPLRLPCGAVVVEVRMGC